MESEASEWIAYWPPTLSDYGYIWASDEVYALWPLEAHGIYVLAATLIVSQEIA